MFVPFFITRLLSRRLRRRALLGLMLLPLALAAQVPERPSNLELVGSFGRIGVGQGEPSDALGSLELRLPQDWHGIRPWLGMSVMDNGAWFAGAGFIYDFTPARNWTVTLGSGPFYYKGKGERRDLGLDLEFYSFIEATRQLGRDLRAGLRVGHLSNGGLGRRNPGTENVTLVVVLPLDRARRN